MIHCWNRWSSIELIDHDQLAGYDSPTPPARPATIMATVLFDTKQPEPHRFVPRQVEVFDPRTPASATQGMTWIDPLGNTHTPALPARWPACPLCDAPLHRIQESEEWVCEPKPAGPRGLASPV